MSRRRGAAHTNNGDLRFSLIQLVGACNSVSNIQVLCDGVKE